MNAMEEKHLTIEALVNGQSVGKEEINDPFLHNTTTVELSLWDRIKLLFAGRMVFEVRIRGDQEAVRHWFRTDEMPSGGEGGPYQRTPS